MRELAEIIERVERLTGEPSSAEMEELIRLSPWYDTHPSYDRVWTAFTRSMHGSLDAAIALTERVLPGWGWDLASNTEHIKACLNPEYGEPIGKHPHWAAVANTSAKTFHDGATPAIALVLATLKSLASQIVEEPNDRDG